jgi:DNA-directed RNA polymerase subunit M/transcription elongation factor TFIIS
VDLCARAARCCSPATRARVRAGADRSHAGARTLCERARGLTRRRHVEDVVLPVVVRGPPDGGVCARAAHRGRRARRGPRSANLLYPKEDRAGKTLMAYCKRCGHEEPGPEGFECVFKHLIVRTAECVEGSRAPRAPRRRVAVRASTRVVPSPCAPRRNALEKVRTDVTLDPTLPRQSTDCPSCGHAEEAVYFLAPPSRTDERMHLIFVCTRCRHKWKA